MNGRRWGIVAALALAGGLLWGSRPSPEPSYQGKPASYWATRALDQTPFPLPASTDPFQTMGVAAAPAIVAALREKNSWRHKPIYARFHAQLPSLLQRRLPPPLPPNDSGFGHDSGFGLAFLAGRVFQRFGVGLDPLLPSLVSDRNVLVRRAAAHLLVASPADARVASKLVFAALRDRDPIVRLFAVAAARRADESAIPLLIQNLSNQDRVRSNEVIYLRAAAADQLGLWGARATSAVPQLRQLSGDLDEETRTRAMVALLRIERDHAMLNPLLNELRRAGNSQIRVRIIGALGELGPDAREAAPALVDIWKRKSEYLSDPTDRMATYLSESIAKSLKQIAPDVAAREGIE